MSITQEYLKSILHYGPETGLFVWIKSKRVGWNGKIAGCTKTHSNCTGLQYVEVRIDGRLYKAHRLVWLYVTGAMPVGLVDHWDGDGTNNRFGNLRNADAINNTHNSRKPSTNTSGYKGVYPHKKNGAWVAQISHKYRQYYLATATKPKAIGTIPRERPIVLGIRLTIWPGVSPSIVAVTAP
jgi:hypothetical protein